MAKGELTVVRRNTAMTLAGIVTVPIASLMSDEVPDGSYLFGFDASDPANENLVLSTDGEASREPLQHVAEPFLMSSWCAKKILLKQPGEDGVRPQIRVMLIDPNGETLSFVSGGIVMSLDLIRTLRGDGPYNPPVPILVLPQKTRMGFTMYKLRIQTREPVKQSSK